jgi:uncharacterized protein (DUF302 family)
MAFHIRLIVDRLRTENLRRLAPPITTRLLVLGLGLGLSLGPATSAMAEVVRRESPRPVKATIDRLETIVREKGFTVFARIDHGAGAKTVNQDLRPTELLIFGNPVGGTPLMQAEQTMGLSLPLRALAWQDAQGKVWLGYDTPADLMALRGQNREHPAAVRATEAMKALTDAAVAP